MYVWLMCGDMVCVCVADVWGHGVCVWLMYGDMVCVCVADVWGHGVCMCG